MISIVIFFNEMQIHPICALPTAFATLCGSILLLAGTARGDLVTERNN